MTSLRQRMLEDMQVRQLSPATQRSYFGAVARFARHFGRPPDCLSPIEIRAYQVHLTNERRLAPSSLIVAVSALRFLYRVTLKKRWVFDDLIPLPKKPRSFYRDRYEALTGRSLRQCPRCHDGDMHVVDRLVNAWPCPAILDSS